MLIVMHILILLVMPVVMPGVVNRTKAIWAGRKGFPVFQLMFDIFRLLRKTPVISNRSSWIFEISAVLFLSTTILAALVTPVIPGAGLFSFDYDFIFFAYMLAFGRIAIILGALDTGSSFEGMGASREATFPSLIEPVFFIVMGTLSLISPYPSLASLVSTGANLSGDHLPALVLCSIAFFIFLQTESARVPVDDPNTHLELTMIHEVMILDHSGPDLAFMQYASGLKMVILASLIASMFNPYSAEINPIEATAASIAIIIGLSIFIGLIESLIARMRLKMIPLYLLLAFTLSATALLLTLAERWKLV